ncbi:transcriptional repressor [Ectothiorhodospiraceae bacterium 2226]|nr:transcriptional repressor [Ectothiorhodospiraceae bacterium 2226]
MAKFQDITPSTRRVIELLQAHGIQPTQQRVDIGEILFAQPQHMSAEQVLTLVNQDQPGSVSKATVYNTLGLFAEKGLVREVIVDPSKVFYDSNTSDHHHFYNVDTGALTDVDAEHVAVTRLPQLPDGTEAAGVDIIIRIRSAHAPR